MNSQKGNSNFLHKKLHLKTPDIDRISCTLKIHFCEKLNLKSLYKFDPWMYMFRLSRWLCYGNGFVLILIWYSMYCHYACIAHLHNYFLHPGKVVFVSAQSLFNVYGIMTLSITTSESKTLRILTFNITIVMLSHIFKLLWCVTMCRCLECCRTECYYAELYYTHWSYAGWRSEECS